MLWLPLFWMRYLGLLLRMFSKIKMINGYNGFWVGKSKLYNFLNIAIVLSIVFFVFLSPLVSSASTQTGLEQAAKEGFSGTPAITDIPQAIGKIVGLALSFIGLAFFVLMIYGGFIWMFARGNDQDVQKAKDLIQAAIIGLIIVLAAYAITVFIGNALTGGGTSSSGAQYLPRADPQ